MGGFADVIEAVQGLAADYGVVSQPAPIGGSGLIDLARNWQPGIHRDRLLRILKEAGASQARVVSDNTETSLVIQTPWTTGLDATSVYVIL